LTIHLPGCFPQTHLVILPASERSSGGIYWESGMSLGCDGIPGNVFKLAEVDKGKARPEVLTLTIANKRRIVQEIDLLSMVSLIFRNTMPTQVV